MQNQLTMLEKVPGFSKPTAKYQCSCGTQKNIRIENVRNGKVVSCGCLRSQMLSTASARRALSQHSYAMRWQELEKWGARSPQLKELLREIAKEYPVYV